jgi:preprotein translocase subunit SecA
MANGAGPQARAGVARFASLCEKSLMSSIPSSTWRMLAARNHTDELPEGADARWEAARGIVKRLGRSTAAYLARADAVLALESTYHTLTNAKLQEACKEMRDSFRAGGDEDKLLPQALAMVREVCGRTLGMTPYREQVAGALAMIDGCVAEMATGEGKTLTATMPATIGGWRGRGCHVITVNDYLAARDAHEMGPVYKFCGLSVASIGQDVKPPERRAGYDADITYLTNKEVCADFLRDRLALGRLKGVTSAILGKWISKQGTDRLVMRGLEYAIVDEADSVLVDEAVTPLIISGDAPNSDQVDAYKQAVELASQLTLQEHFVPNTQYREVELTDAGWEYLGDIAEPLGGIWTGARRREELVVQALTARIFFQKGKQYIVDDEGKVVIVDEFTGRLMPDRTWREGLHQAIEAKENLTVNPAKDTFARISFQRFFRTYKKLCGMTGTAKEESRELWQIYNLPVVEIPTHKPKIRTQAVDQIYATEAVKYEAIVAEIEKVHATGRPVLVGTRSVRSSEYLSAMLSEKKLPHEVLNAVRHAEEAQIVAGAGQPGRITVATNMAGRGTDIKLGKGVAELGGLCVLATERHESPRVDRQLFGRAGRQGDPGSAAAYVSLEDELLLRHAPHLQKLFKRRFGETEKPIDNAIVRRMFTRAQRKAQKVSLAQRKQVLQSDNWLNESLGFAGTE